MKKVKDKQRADPIKSRKPEIPLTGAGMDTINSYFSCSPPFFNGHIDILVLLGKGGRVASGISLSQFVSKNLAVKNLDDSNPRESILRHAKVCIAHDMGLDADSFVCPEKHIASPALGVF